MEKKLVLDVNETPTKKAWALLSIQHVLAMFGATVLVPILTGLPIDVSLAASGIGTIIYAICTKFKSPVYLGSSFAYIVPIQTGLAYKMIDGIPNYAAVMIGLTSVGLFYLLISLIVKFIGTKWLNKVLPPIVIGPGIMIIGLGLATSPINQIGTSVEGIIVAIFTVLVIALLTVYAKGILKIIPIFVGIVSGYILATVLGLVDFSSVASAPWFSIPSFTWTKEIRMLELNEIADILVLFLPVAIVTITEHIGDHLVLSNVIGKDLLKDPGLSRTLAGDGIATMVSGLIGGPANTTYGENTGVISITRVASVKVIITAAVIAILLSFFGKFTSLIQTIPAPVLGGVGLVLYGIIASGGVRVLINSKIDFNKPKNLVIDSVMLIAGVGGLKFGLLSAMATSVILGIILNLILSIKTMDNSK